MMILHSWNAPYDGWVTDTIRQAFANTFCVEIDHRDFDGDLFARVMSGLRWASLVIGIFDAVSLNLAFEIGYALALGKPLLLLEPESPTVDVQRYFEEEDAHRPGQNPPFRFDDDWADLKGPIRCQTDFRSPDRLLADLRKAMPKTDELGRSLVGKVVDTWRGHLLNGIQDISARTRARQILDSLASIDFDRPLLPDTDHVSLVDVIENNFDPQLCLLPSPKA